MVWGGSILDMFVWSPKCLLYLGVHIFPKTWEALCYYLLISFARPLACELEHYCTLKVRNLVFYLYSVSLMDLFIISFFKLVNILIHYPYLKFWKSFFCLVQSVEVSFDSLNFLLPRLLFVICPNHSLLNSDLLMFSYLVSSFICFFFLFVLGTHWLFLQ